MKFRGSGFLVLGIWWPVALTVAAGVIAIGLADIRLGGQLICGALVGAAVVRLVTSPARRAGGLVVRSRGFDVLVLVMLALGVLIASATVNLGTSDANRPPPRSASS